MYVQCVLLVGVRLDGRGVRRGQGERPEHHAQREGGDQRVCSAAALAEEAAADRVAKEVAHVAVVQHEGPFGRGR